VQYANDLDSPMLISLNAKTPTGTEHALKFDATALVVQATSEVGEEVRLPNFESRKQQKQSEYSCEREQGDLADEPGPEDHKPLQEYQRSLKQPPRAGDEHKDATRFPPRAIVT